MPAAFDSQVAKLLTDPQDARLGSDPCELEGLALGFGAGREVFADVLTIDATGYPKNDIPGGIREPQNDERIFSVHVDLPRQLGKSEVGKI